MKIIYYIFVVVLGVILTTTQVSGKGKQKEMISVDTVLVSGGVSYAFCSINERCTYAQILSWMKKNNLESSGKDGLIAISSLTSGISILGIDTPENLERADGKLWIWILGVDGNLYRISDIKVFGGKWFTNSPRHLLLKVGNPLIVKK